MKISQAVMEIAIIEERETGKKTSEKVLKIAESVYQMSLRLGEIGCRHAQEGCEPVSANEVHRLTAVIADPYLRAAITSLMYEAYIDGYKSAEVHHV